MSSLTATQVAQKVLDRLTGQGEDAADYFLPDIESSITDALQRTARQIADSDEFYELQKEFTLSAVGGKADITDSTIIVDTIAHTGLVRIFNKIGLNISGSFPNILVNATPVFIASDAGGSYIEGTATSFFNPPTCSGYPYSQPIIQVDSTTQVRMALNHCNAPFGITLDLFRPVIAKPVPNVASLSATLQNDIGHYAVIGKSLYLRDTTGSLGFTGPVKTIVSFVPTLSELPTRFENRLIDTLVQMAHEKKSK